MESDSTSVVAPLLPDLDLLFANDFEAEKITGIEVGRGANLAKAKVELAGSELLKRGVREWVIIHFPEGVCACSAAGERVWQASVKLPRFRNCWYGRRRGCIGDGRAVWMARRLAHAARAGVGRLHRCCFLAASNVFRRDRQFGGVSGSRSAFWLRREFVNAARVRVQGVSVSLQTGRVKARATVRKP